MPRKLIGRLRKVPGVRPLLDLNARMETWWFDLCYNVDTSLDVPEQEKRGWRNDKVNFHYMPTRPKWVRQVLLHLPPSVRDEYTFIDFGSGKGRVLMMAAQFGFKKVYGIELRKELHQQACENLRRFRGADGSHIESIYGDAAGYDIPNEKLVLFFFNPFGEEVMKRVLSNLEQSLQANFRDVWVLLHGSVCSELADQSSWLKLEMAHRAYRIYRSVSHQEGRSGR